MSEKIQPSHRDRTAFVYVRQSTMDQVRHNRESQRRQYGLADRAGQLGFSRVQVIDDDLGRSGSGAKQRPGFDRLVGAVCAGDVGAVFALEASRLARNNRDWHYLIDLCAMTGTLVIDHDGVYDPRQLNDRLLLGLKGSLAEFELGLLRQRAQEALLQMVRRGEVLFEPPIGYVRTDDNRLEMTADLQVQDAIKGVFAKFAELGSARQALLWYRGNMLSLPTWSADGGPRQVVWRLPGYRRVLSILKNPLYSGAFVHGRHGVRTVISDGRARKTYGHDVPLHQWGVVIQGHHAGYIDWDTYLRNQEQIEGNSLSGRRNDGTSRGAARGGPALLAGLFRCRRCGRKLHVNYCGVKSRVTRYYCGQAQLMHGTAMCLSFGGLRVEQSVASTVLQALRPEGVAAALGALDKLREQEDQRHRALRLALEKADYEADRMRRQYEAVEPENRLVAGELERRWEQALSRAAELRDRLGAARKEGEKLSQVERDRLLELGSDLEAVWNHPSATAVLKKRILRTVLNEIMVDVSDEPAEVRMWLHWAGGVHTELVVPRSRTGQHRYCTDRNVVDLIRDLAKVCDDKSIAAILNRMGYRTGKENNWTQGRVLSLRRSEQIPLLYDAEHREWLTLDEAAEELAVGKSVVRRLLADGDLPGHQVVHSAPWVIERKDLSLSAVQAAVKAAQAGRKRPRINDSDSQVLMFQADGEV